MSADSSVLQIVILQDGALVGTEVFPYGSYQLGRDAGNDLVLADPRVSSRHATVAFKEGRIYVRDDNSANGTFVNGQRAAQVEVKTIDDVTIGPFTLKFRIVGKKAAGAVPGHTVIAPTSAEVSGHTAPDRPSQRATARGSEFPDAATDPGESQKEPNPLGPGRPPPGRGPQLKVVRGGAPAPPPSSRRLESTVPSARRAAAAVKAVKDPTSRPADAPPPGPPVPAPPVHGGRIPTAEVPVPDVSLDGARAVARDEPVLRARVLWGKSTVWVRSFDPGSKVVAGASETADLPVYNFAFPGERFVVARPARGGWVARVPRGAGAYALRGDTWAEVRGEADASGHATLIPLEIGRPLRIVHGRLCVELLPDLVPAVPSRDFKSGIDPQIGYPFAACLFAVGVMLLAMPALQKDVPDFSPQKLAPIRAVLAPPPKKPDKTKELVLKEDKPTERPKEAKEKPTPQKVVKQQVAMAIQAVKKVTAGAAVQSLLAAVGKIGGPKGVGDKGMGYKLSPLFGKPPIAMAGMGVGPGLGGFGPLTKSLGELRGMGGGGPGFLGTAGIGKGRVGGLVVSAPKGQAKIRGTMDREAIAKVINEHIAEIRACYERALLKEAGLTGKLVFEWTIDLGGAVSEVKVKVAGLKSTDATNCMIGSLRTWRFPKPVGGIVVVSYPFIFNSVGF